MTQLTKFFALRGGLDLVSPAIETPPGHAIAAMNYEPVQRGYRRVQGFERYDGQPKPSEASYWVLNFDAGTATIAEGATVTGAVSGATGKTLVAMVVSSGAFGTSDAAGYLVLTGVSGTFLDNENLQVSAVTKCVANGAATARGASNDTDDTTWYRDAIETARALIAKLPGSGRIRGLWWYSSTVYAFRNDPINAVTFDGATDVRRGAGLTGAADSSDLLMSFWIKPASLAPAFILGAAQAGVRIEIDASGKFSFQASTFTFTSALALTLDEWQHVLLRVDTNQVAGAKVAQLYIDDKLNVTVTADSGGAFNIDFTQTNWCVGSSFGGDELSADIAEFWFGPGQALDLSTTSNRRKFISADGEAVDLGATGSTPTGTAPRLYLQGNAAGYLTNSGTGGDLTTLNGALADADDTPPFVGTECQMWKATTAGWTEVALGYSLSFTSGGTTEIAEGDTITGETSAATGVVGRVILTSGSWAAGDAAGRFILTSQTGTFQSETVKVGATLNLATIAGDSTANTLQPSGRFEFVNHNFFGASDLRRMYGCDGVSKAFEFDGSVFVPIVTGMATDTPDHIGVYKQHLILSFPGGSIQNSGTGEPYEWSAISGASEIGLGEDVTGFGHDVSRGLAITGRSKIAMLYGNDATDFVLDVVSEDTGAVEWTVQKLGQLMFMDDRGVRDMRSAAQYGNFNIGTITEMVEPLLKAKKAAGVEPINSCRVRKKDQYRLFFDDGTGIAIYLGRKDPEIVPFDLDKVVYAIASCECATLGEVMFFGSDDGYVYELDAGTSFDGSAVGAYLRLPFNHVGSPTQNKRWHKATLEVDAAPTTTLAMTAEFSYADPDQPPAVEQSFSVRGGGGFWNEDNWNDFYWSSPVEGLAECPLDGMGRNISVAVISSTTYEEPHTIHGITLHYSYRGLAR